MKPKDIFMSTYIIITLSIVIIITALLCNQWIYSYIPSDNLSADYKEYEINSTKNESMEGLIAYMQSNCDKFRLQKQVSDEYAGIYMKDYKLNLKLIEGREFTKEDFEQNKDVVMIAEECLKDTYKGGSKRYITIQEKIYEVIGVFSKDKNTINQNTNAFINMSSKQFLKTNTEVTGTYYLDCKQDLHDLLAEKYNIKENNTIYDLSYAKHFERVKDVAFVLVKIILCGVVLFSVTWMFLFAFWFGGEKEMIVSKYLDGVTRGKIAFLTLKKWMLTNSFGVMISIFLGTVSLICKEYLFLLLGIEILYILFSSGAVLLFTNRRIKEIRHIYKGVDNVCHL